MHCFCRRRNQITQTLTNAKWADELLNKSAHASDSRHTTHAIFAQELTKIANNSGVLTTCVESRLPYRDAGIDNPTRKRADMMTLTGYGVTPNAQRNFSTDTRLIMDVTIGHVFDTHHNFKPNTLQNMGNSKCLKYATHYSRRINSKGLNILSNGSVLMRSLELCSERPCKSRDPDARKLFNTSLMLSKTFQFFSLVLNGNIFQWRKSETRTHA